MGTSTLAALAGMGLFAIVVMIVVGIALAALVLSVAFRLVVGYMPSYLRALGAVVLTWIAGAVAMAIVGMISHGGGTGGLLSLVVQFLVGAAVVNYLLLAQNGSQIGYGKACVVQLIYLVIFIVLAVIFAALAAMFFGGMLAHA